MLQSDRELTAPESPKYIPVDPKGVPSEKTVFAPYIFGSRAEVWQKIFGPNIDEMTSDPRTLNLLSTLIVYAEPKTIVEVGTYRGWGTATLAETLRVYDLPGHVWSCDPVDHGVHEMLDQASLSERVTLVHGTFEDLLAELNSLSHGVIAPIDFCYVDGANRLPYTKLALKNMGSPGIVAVDDVAGDWKGSKTLRRMADLYLPQHRGLVLITT